MCFNLNLLNICLAKSANNNNNNNSKKNKNNTNSKKSTTSSKKSSNDSICSAEANANNDTNNNNNVEALNHPNVDSSLGSVINANNNNNNSSKPLPPPPPPPPSSKLVLQHPRTLALKHSNNLNQPVNEVECENEETLNSLYLANNISYLVDQDRIVDTPCAHAQALHDSILDLDLCPATTNAVDYRYNDYDNDDEYDDYEQQGKKFKKKNEKQVRLNK